MSIKKYTILVSVLFFAACTMQTDKSDTANVIETGLNPDLPQMKYLANGNLIAWWTETMTEGQEPVVATAVSSNHGISFSEPAQIPETKGISAAHGESLPALTEKPNGDLVLVFSAKNDEAEFRFASSAKYIQSFDGGKSWTQPEIIHNTDKNIENSHSFVAATLLPDGEVGSVWLDGRHKLDHQVMYFAKTSGRDGFMEDFQIGGPTCQCCKNSMLVDQDGALHISYRGLEDGTRDIMHFKSNDAGMTFTEPLKVSDDGWKIDACPHNGPAMTLSEDGELHVVWYSLAGAEGLFHAVSNDKGTTFTPRIQISDNPVAKHPQIEVIDDMAVAVWDELTGNGKNAHKRVAISVIREGDVLETSILSEANREAWAPNLVKLENGNILVTWVENIEGVQILRREMIDGNILKTERILASL